MSHNELPKVQMEVLIFGHLQRQMVWDLKKTIDESQWLHFHDLTWLSFKGLRVKIITAHNQAQGLPRHTKVCIHHTISFKNPTEYNAATRMLENRFGKMYPLHQIVKWEQEL